MEAIQETGERAAGAVTIIFWQAISGPSRRKLTAHQNIAMKIYPKTSPPVCRVSTGRPNVSTGRQSEFCLDSRFSLRLIRPKPCGEKTCGNDGLSLTKEAPLGSKMRGINPQ